MKGPDVPGHGISIFIIIDREKVSTEDQYSFETYYFIFSHTTTAPFESYIRALNMD